MKRLSKKILTAAAIAFMVFGFAVSAAGCSSGNDSRESGKNTLIYGSGDYTRINPAIDEHGEINILLFDGLMAHDRENNPVPRIAQSYEIDKASNTYTFKLKKGIKWHDGAELTAKDVKFTFEAIMNPDNQSENASNYEDVESIEIIDDYTVAFKLSAPNYAFLEYMTMAILPEHLLNGKDMQKDEFFRNPVGTGPYRLKSWDEGQAIILEKNEDYFMVAPDIDEIIFKIVPDDSAKALQLKTGELDMAQVTPKDEKSLREVSKLIKYDMKTSDYRGILYNFNNEYWQKNADLIPAINYGIDRQAMLDSVLLGCGETAYSPLQRNIYNYDGAEHYDYDKEKAEKMLRDAGCTKGDDGFYRRDGQKIGFTLNAAAGDQVRIDMAQIAAQQLQEIGLDVRVKVCTSMDWGNQECCIIGWGSPFDADDHTYKVFGTDKGANYSSYSNPKVDEYLTEARQTDVPEERAAAYAKFQEELAAKPAYTFFCYIDAIYMADEKIKGIDKDVIMGHHGVGIFWNVCDWTIENE